MLSLFEFFVKYIVQPRREISEKATRLSVSHALAPGFFTQVKYDAACAIARRHDLLGIHVESVRLARPASPILVTVRTVVPVCVPVVAVSSSINILTRHNRRHNRRLNRRHNCRHSSLANNRQHQRQSANGSAATPAAPAGQQQSTSPGPKGRGRGRGNTVNTV